MMIFNQYGPAKIFKFLYNPYWLRALSLLSLGEGVGGEVLK